MSNSLLFSVTKQYILQIYPTCVIYRLLHSQNYFICIVSSIPLLLSFFLITLFLYNFKLTEKLQEYKWKFCILFNLIFHYLHFSLFTLLSLHLQSTVLLYNPIYVIVQHKRVPSNLSSLHICNLLL